jgi:hypothetical protein
VVGEGRALMAAFKAKRLKIRILKTMILNRLKEPVA